MDKSLLSCPICESKNIAIISDTLRIKRVYSVWKDEAGIASTVESYISKTHDVLCQCGNPECPEGSGVEHLKWIEEVED